MKDEDKIKDHLIKELVELRRRIIEQEASETEVARGYYIPKMLSTLQRL